MGNITTMNNQCHFDVVFNTMEEAQGFMHLLERLTAWVFNGRDGDYIPFELPNGNSGGLWVKPGPFSNHKIIFFKVENVNAFLTEHGISLPATHKGDSHPRDGKPWAVFPSTANEFFGIHQE